MVEHGFIDTRRPYRSAAHEKAMRSIAACLNDKNRQRAVGGVTAAQAAVLGLPALAEPQPLTDTQQEALEGVAMLLKEMGDTARQINIQAAAFGLPLPRLHLAECSLYNGALYRVASDADIAAKKMGGAVVLDKLRNEKQRQRLRRMVGLQEAA